MIVKNIKYLRKKHGYTQETFAQALGINRPSVGAYEEGRADPRLNTLACMAELFNVTVDELINEDLTNNKRIPKQNVRTLTITVNQSSNQEGIQLVPVKAAAGYTNGYADPEFITDLPQFQIPILPKGGIYRAFEISGDSMLPLASGSIIVGKYVEQTSEIKNGKTYILVTKAEGIVYKRVFNYLEERGKFYLVSDNTSYKAYEIDPEEILEVWEAKAYISLEFPDPAFSGELSIQQLASMIGSMKNEIDHIKNSKS